MKIQNRCARFRESGAPYSIYLLIDPRDGSVHYVGISKHPHERYGQHLRYGEDCNPIKDAWIFDLRQHGLLPIQIIIGSAETRIAAGQQEKYWINFYRSQHAPLTNRRRTCSKAMEVLA